MIHQLNKKLALRLAGVENAVYDIPRDLFAGNSDAAVIENVCAQFRIEEPELLLEQKSRDDFEESTAKGRNIILRVKIPIRGDATLFPQHIEDSYLIGDVSVEGATLFLRHKMAPELSGRTQTWIEKDLKLIGQWQTQISKCLRDYHDETERLATIAVRRRRQDIAIAKVIWSNLQIPLKRSSAQTQQVMLPLVRKAHPLQPTTARNYELSDLEYGYILQVLASMVQVMERSPATFANMGEVELRDILLVCLNSHYEPGATGETFSVRGKTDIYLAHETKSAFIAECKMWRGTKKLLEAIDQLFGYTSWRDTKTAIIVFCKKNNPTAVFESIRTVVQVHPEVLDATGEQTGKSQIAFTFRHPADDGGSMKVTFMVFDVPSIAKVPEPDGEE